MKHPSGCFCVRFFHYIYTTFRGKKCIIKRQIKRTTNEKEKLKQEIEETYYFENTKEIDILIEDYYNNLTPKSIQEAKRIKTLLKTNTLKETANKLKLKEKKLKGKIKYLKKKGLL